MSEWREHRLWLSLMAAALIIALVGTPLLGVARKAALAHLTQTRAATAAAAQALTQLQADIALTQKLQTEISAEETAKFLAPVDRLQAMKILERRAAQARLSKFTYTLSPETKKSIATVGAGAQDFTSSTLTLSAAAPTDIDVYMFFDRLQKSFPGRFSLRTFSLTRIGAADAPATAANLRLNASGEWLSNGAPKNLAAAEAR